MLWNHLPKWKVLVWRRKLGQFFFVTGKIVVANGIYLPKLAKLYETFTGFIICDTMTNSKIRYVYNHSSEIRSLCSWKLSRKIIYHERFLSFPEAKRLLSPNLGIFNDFKVLVIFFSSNLKMFFLKIFVTKIKPVLNEYTCITVL